MRGKRKIFNWEKLENLRPDVSLVIALQPILLKPTIASKPHDVIPPRKASRISLTSQFRSSKKILNLVNTLCRGEVPCEYNGIAGAAGHDVEGPSVTAIHLTNLTELEKLGKWINKQLDRLNVPHSCVKVIYDSASKEIAQKCFPKSPELVSVEDMQGCETLVGISFYSPPGDTYHHVILEMASRTTFKLFLVIRDNQALWDNVTSLDGNIIIVGDYLSETEETLGSQINV